MSDFISQSKMASILERHRGSEIGYVLERAIINELLFYLSAKGVDLDKWGVVLHEMRGSYLVEVYSKAPKVQKKSVKPNKKKLLSLKRLRRRS